MVFEVSYERTVPARRPEGHAAAAPRYGLRWHKPIVAIVSDYFAIQAPGLSWSQQQEFFERARQSFATNDGPDSCEIMRATDENQSINAIVVAYWVDPVKHARWSNASSLVAWFKSADRLSDAVGAWRETISVPYDRHETIYSEPWYKIGIGRTSHSEVMPITTNGFFGAARDRLPLSAIDPLDSPHGDRLPPSGLCESKGRRLRIAVPVNMVTLRSGQYWAHAGQEQLDDYVNNMRPRLMTGMNYLTEHKEETGTLSLLVMTNLDDDGTERRETSVLAHFISLAQLEKWSASHKTHLAIYQHAIAMNRKYKQEREFVSWHELFVNQAATFEYVNCHPRTGLLPYFEPMAISR